MKSRSREFSAYAARDELLRSLGFTSYRAYLESPLWAGIRQQVLSRDGHLCVACGNAATQVHHKRYAKAVLLGMNLRPLLSLCSRCHHEAEVSVRFGKVGLTRANKRLKRIQKQNIKATAWRNNPEYRSLLSLLKQLHQRPRKEVHEQINMTRKRLRQIKQSTQPQMAKWPGSTDRQGESTATTDPHKDVSTSVFVIAALTEASGTSPVKVSAYP